MFYVVLSATVDYDSDRLPDIRFWRNIPSIKVMAYLPIFLNE